ncbi:related to phenylacetyl-CoA ligase [Pseudozyma flocculosa]|uniref:Related to phenylacetyl-CoA ligase n=1 Tax=Pseudozyma flocculosa TaxID=84751 RepID=A0A5C3F192_9BASI|nr:related to phenylacetyl-CoA ligase [Pseudozyma flocculosa]
MIHTSAAQPVNAFPDTDIYTFLFEHFPPQRADHFQLDWDHRVATFTPNSVEFPIALWASQRLGGVVSAANPAFGVSELVYQLQTANASVLFLGHDQATLDVGLEAAKQVGLEKKRIVVIQDPQAVHKYSEANYGRIQKRTQGMWTVAGLVEEGREILQRQGPACLERRRFQPGESKSKLALLSFSSGTTGLPKGVAIQHSAPIANVLQLCAFNQISSRLGEDQGRFRPGTDIALGVLPQFHIYGLIVGVHTMFYAGVTNVIIPRFRGIEAMVKTIVKYGISIWWLVPPQIVLLCKDPSVPPYIEQLRKVCHFVMVGAAPLSDDLSRQFMRALPGIDWGQGYGMSETCTVTTMHPPGMDAVLGSAGRLISNTEARVVDAQGKDCGFDTPGELWIRGPQNTLGYSNNAKATAEMFLPDGWIRTGDEVVINRQGDVTIVDRLKELIKVKGFQVAPAELEGCILNQESVADVGVVGVTDEDNGECPLAFVVWKEEVRQKLQRGEVKEDDVVRQVVEFVKKEKVKYKHLGGVVVLDTIPKTASGKILRRNMREMAKKLDESVTKRFKEVRRQNKL